MKKISSLILLCVINSGSLFSQSYEDVINQASACFKTKEYSKGVALYKKAKEMNPDLSMYNAACLASLAGNKDLAFEWLNDALDRGRKVGMYMLVDSDFDSIRDDERWTMLESKADSLGMFPKDKTTACMLMKIYTADQKIRQEYYFAMQKGGNNKVELDSIGRFMGELNNKNSHIVDSLLSIRGWLGYDEVGEEASTAIFLILQHSDIKMIEKYLPAFREAVKVGNSNGEHLAYVEDRYALWSGKKQIYGTQASWDERKQTSVIKLSGIEDSKHVNDRRKAVGLKTLEEYAKSMNYTIEE